MTERRVYVTAEPATVYRVSGGRGKRRFLTRGTAYRRAATNILIDAFTDGEGCDCHHDVASDPGHYAMCDYHEWEFGDSEYGLGRQSDEAIAILARSLREADDEAARAEATP